MLKMTPEDWDFLADAIRQSSCGREISSNYLVRMLRKKAADERNKIEEEERFKDSLIDYVNDV